MAIRGNKVAAGWSKAKTDRATREVGEKARPQQGRKTPHHNGGSPTFRRRRIGPSSSGFCTSARLLYDFCGCMREGLISPSPQSYFTEKVYEGKLIFGS
jgi:hypothetical protein